jgi:hypothetical protein
MSNVFKVLTSVLLIDSTQFKTLAPTAQTNILRQIPAGGEVKFVDSFTALRNRRSLVDELIKGKDVSMRLEFLELELTEEEKQILQRVQPIIARILDTPSELGNPNYKWLLVTPSAGANLKMTSNLIKRGDNSIGVKTAEKIWKKASQLWGGLVVSQKTMVVQAGGYWSCNVDFYDDRIKIGCQTIYRADVEAVARNYGWEPAML